MHAIERIYGYAAQDSGYYYADVINSDNARSDLINYRYMLNKMLEIMHKKGLDIHNFQATLYTLLATYPDLQNYLDTIKTKTLIKQVCKRMLPKFILNLLKKIRHRKERR
jgi:lipopolysaccharide biosynthesis protein